MICKKWAALLLAVVLTFGLAGCGSKDEVGGAANDKDVVASVNDAEITYGQLNEFLKLSALIAGQDLSSLEAQPEMMMYLRQSMLRNMVSYQAMRLSLEEKGDEIFPDDYQTQLDDFLKSAQEPVKDQGISDATLTDYFNLSYYAAPFNDEANDAVTDEEMEAYYETHLADKYTTTAARGEVSHILVKDEALANEIYDKLENGADFAEMAKEYGTDGTKDTGGSLGTVSEDDTKYIADFMKGAFALKSGEISKPVKTEFGYHLIKMDNREEAGVVIPFEEVKENIHTTLASGKYNEIITKLLERYDVKYYGEFAGDDADTDGGNADGEDGGTGEAE